jgi:hypothetical protein
MSEHILTHKHQAHKHQTNNHAASGWRIHCGVEVTESSTNKQLTLSGDITLRQCQFSNTFHIAVSTKNTIYLGCLVETNEQRALLCLRTLCALGCTSARATLKLQYTSWSMWEVKSRMMRKRLIKNFVDLVTDCFRVFSSDLIQTCVKEFSIHTYALTEAMSVCVSLDVVCGVQSISHPNSSPSPCRTSLGGGLMSRVKGPCNASCNAAASLGTTKAAASAGEYMEV